MMCMDSLLLPAREETPKQRLVILTSWFYSSIGLIQRVFGRRQREGAGVGDLWSEPDSLAWEGKVATPLES